MATTRWASKSAATFLRFSGFRRGFCRVTFGPPASTTIDEEKIKEEMRLLFPQHLKQKRDPRKQLCVIQSFRHELQVGQWLTGANYYYFEKEEDMYDDDKKMHAGGIRFLVDNEKGMLEVGRFYGEFED